VEKLLEGDYKTYEKECPWKQQEEEKCERHAPLQDVPCGAVEDDYEEQVCCICLMEYESGDTFIAPQTCTHKFHKECILDWLELRLNTVCPVCRQDIVSNHDVLEMARSLQRLQQREEQANHPNGGNSRPKPFRILPSFFRSRRNAESNDNNTSRIRNYVVQDSDFPPPILRNEQESVYLEDNNSLNTSISEMRSPDAIWTLVYDDQTQLDDGDVDDQYQVDVDQENQMDISTSSSLLSSIPSHIANHYSIQAPHQDQHIQIQLHDAHVHRQTQVAHAHRHDEKQVGDDDLHTITKLEEGMLACNSCHDSPSSPPHGVDVDNKSQDDGNDKNQVDDVFNNVTEVEEGIVACNSCHDSPSSPPPP